MSDEQNPRRDLHNVIAAALRGALSERDTLPRSSREFRKAWIGHLHDGFARQYERAAVFSCSRQASHVAARWRRYEFLHDICVAQVARQDAPYQIDQSVALLRRVIWQCESEIELDATKVAEDLSKLVAGSADHKLLVAARPAANRDSKKMAQIPARGRRTGAGQFFCRANANVCIPDAGI